MNGAGPQFSALGRFAMRRREDSAGHSGRASLYEQIEQAAGYDAADKLIADFGGRRVYIPRTPVLGDLLTRSIGLEAALAMAREFGGDRLLIPTISDRDRRRVRIVAMRADGISISRIAHELRCTERYVYKVLADFQRMKQGAGLDDQDARPNDRNAANAASGEK